MRSWPGLLEPKRADGLGPFVASWRSALQASCLPFHYLRNRWPTRTLGVLGPFRAASPSLAASAGLGWLGFPSLGLTPFPEKLGSFLQAVPCPSLAPLACYLSFYF